MQNHFDKYTKKSKDESIILPQRRENDESHDEGGLAEQTMLTMCEEIEGLLKINMNKVNEENQVKINMIGGGSEHKVTVSRTINASGLNQ